MEHRLEIFDTPDAVARAAAAFVLEQATTAVGKRGRFWLAVSGGRTPWDMFGILTTTDMPWDRTIFLQVDERVAPAGDPDRNLAHLTAAIGGVPADIRSMPVDDPDLEAAAARYAAGLPDAFDLVHLGLGPDGHTASLVPGDPVLDVSDRLVSLTAGPYQGHRRMTLTYPALARARQLLWLITGEAKRPVLRRLLDGDRSIPAGRVEAPASVVMADTAAAG